ncbi:MAG TPA: hypothetical protein VKD72_17820 [Gemmataceae bacterium]|nr:hypothetical protein [Gemmataceae bacterium]
MKETRQATQSSGTSSRPRRQAGNRRARSAVLSGLVLFALTQLGLGLAIALCLPSVRDPFYSQKAARLKRRLAADPAPLTVVMLGSSRTAYGFAPSPLEGPLTRALGRPVVLFNFGLCGAGPVTELLTLRRLLDDGIRPSLLLVEVLPPLLAGQVPLFEMQEERNPTWALRAADLPLVASYGASVRRGLKREWYRSWLVPSYSHRLDLLNHTFPLLLSHADRRDAFALTDRSGWSRLLVGSPEQRKRALASQNEQYRTFLDGFRLGGPAAEGLCELLETCRRENIPAALVLMPEGPIFRNWYPQAAWDQIETYLAQLRRRFGVPVIRAREWVAKDEAFTDSHHMRPETAAAFTQRLVEEAIIPLLHQGYDPPITVRQGAVGAATRQVSGGGGGSRW